MNSKDRASMVYDLEMKFLDTITFSCANHIIVSKAMKELIENVCEVAVPTQFDDVVFNSFMNKIMPIMIAKYKEIEKAIAVMDNAYDANEYAIILNKMNNANYSNQEVESIKQGLKNRFENIRVFLNFANFMSEVIILQNSIQSNSDPVKMFQRIKKVNALIEHMKKKPHKPSISWVSHCKR